MDEENIIEAIDKEIINLGKTNIIVVGRSGVGKSTLINAVFKCDIAKEGVGQPVTQSITEYPVPHSQVVLFDTKGLEMKGYMEIMNSTEKFIQKQKQSKNRNDHIHLAWMCISQGSSRVEEGETAFIEMLGRYMPVVIILTQCYRNSNDFIAYVESQFKNCKVIPIIAKGEIMANGSCLPAMGLDNLARITEELLPDAHRTAFIAAQKVDFQSRTKKAHAIVATAAVSAAAAGASPIPFSDAAILIPIQAGMIAGITAVFGFKLDRSIIMSILGILGTAAGASGAGILAANLLKLIPGVGSVAGGVINASVASTMTATFGEIYIGILIVLFKEKSNEQPTAEELLAKCKEWKKSQPKKGKK